MALRARSDPSIQQGQTTTAPHQHHSETAPSLQQPTAMEVEPCYMHHNHYHRRGRGQGRSRGTFPTRNFGPSSLPSHFITPNFCTICPPYLPPCTECTQSGCLEMPLGFSHVVSMGHPSGYYPTVPPTQPPAAPPPRQSDSEDSPMVGVCVQQSPVASH